MTYRRNAFIEFEIHDYQNVLIRLTRECMEHITDKHGVVMYNYWENIKDTIQNPELIGESKTIAGVRVYIQENNKTRNFQSKYLVVVVNRNNDVSSAYFRNRINYNNVKKISK